MKPKLKAVNKPLHYSIVHVLAKPGSSATVSNLSVEEKQALAELEREDEGFVQSFRTIIRQLVHIFDHASASDQHA